MGKEIWDNLTDRLKNTFTLKRTKVTLYVATVLWVAVATQMLVNRAFQEELQITDAFVKSETEEMRSSLELVAEYKKGYLSEMEQKDIIYNLADEIGLILDEDVTVWKEDGRTELFVFKQAKQASTEIKLISLQQEDNNTIKMRHYIIVRLSVLQGIKSIDKYKPILEDAFDKMGMQDKQVTMKYEGTREGNLTTTQKHEIAELLVEELQGEIAFEYDEGDLYTVYAYTGMLNEYVESLGNKINVQIAITYNELTNKTKIALATPLLNDSW